LKKKHMQMNVAEKTDVSTSWTEDVFTNLTCKGMETFIKQEYPFIPQYQKAGAESEDVVSATWISTFCQSGLVAFCPEVCWCKDKDAQEKFKKYEPHSSQFFEKYCPTKCKYAVVA